MLGPGGVVERDELLGARGIADQALGSVLGEDESLQAGCARGCLLDGAALDRDAAEGTFVGRDVALLASRASTSLLGLAKLDGSLTAVHRILRDWLIALPHGSPASLHFRSPRRPPGRDCRSPGIHVRGEREAVSAAGDLCLGIPR